VLLSLRPDHAKRDPGDEAVAAREVLAARREAWRSLADEKALLGDRSMQLFVFRRLDMVDAGSKHGNSA
jgi:hypothetical protein